MAVLAAVLAASLFPSAAGLDGPTPLARLTATEANLQGELHSITSGYAAVYFPPGRAGNLQWTLTADRVEVAWTKRVFLEQGRPTDWSQRQSHDETGSPKRGGDTFVDARVSGTSSNTTLEFLVGPLGPNSGTAEMRCDAMSARVANGTDFSVGHGAGSASTPVSVQIEIPARLLEVTAQSGTLSYRGDFQLFVWDQALSATNATRQEVFRAGSWVSSPEPMGPAFIVRERTYQMVQLNVTGGDLTVAAARPSVSVASANSIVGEFGVRFTEAAGEVWEHGAARTVEDQDLDLSGILSIRLANASGPDPLAGLLRAIVDVTAAPEPTSPVVVVHGSGGPLSAPDEGSPVAPKRFAFPLSAWAALFLAVPLVVAIRQFLFRRRLDIVDVEWAVLAGKRRRALSWSWILVRRTPEDPDALFLRGTALLAAQRPRKVLDSLEPLAEKVAPPQRRGIAFVLAVAARAVGDKARARRWGSEASQEPTLLSQMRNEGGWKDLLASSLEDVAGYA